MPSFSKRPSGSKTSRKTTPQMFFGILAAFVAISVATGVLVAGVLVPSVGVLGAAAKAVPETFEEIPSEIELVAPSEESRLLDADGRVIATFFSSQRIVVKGDKIAPIMKEAIISIEDKRFYHHHGVDPEGLARAAVNNLQGASTQGASTITQQYVKNMLMEKGIQEGDQDLIDEAQAQTAERKLREARYALALESKLSKEEILTGYLNVAPFGPNIYGVQAASKAYFSKNADDLSVGEAALLAGLVQSPVEYDPLEHPEAAQDRRDIVLKEMERQGYIDEEQYDKAVDVSVEDSLKPEAKISGCKGAGTMAYFCNFVREQFLADPAYGENYAERLHLLESGGLTLRASINRDMQSDAYNAVTDMVPVDDASQLDTALISINQKNGQILAMAQNTRYGVTTETDKRATEVSYTTGEGEGSGFQPGSTFKMFTLAQWFKEGHSAYESVGSGNRQYDYGSFTCGGQVFPTGPWYVGDLAGKDGATSVVRATQLSINQAYASMASKVDYCNIFQTAADLGVTGADGKPLNHDFPASIIGGADWGVTPLAMARAYGTIANDGTLCQTMALLEVADRDGNVIKSYEPSCKQVLDPTVARQVSTVLQLTANQYGFNLGRPFAAKTGTTDNNSNTWMVGFTPQLTTAAWAGFANASSRPVQDLTINGTYWSVVYGGTFVAPMWLQFMGTALDGTPAEPLAQAFIGNVPAPAAPATPAEGQGQDQGQNQGQGQDQPAAGDNQG